MEFQFVDLCLIPFELLIASHTAQNTLNMQRCQVVVVNNKKGLSPLLLLAMLRFRDFDQCERKKNEFRLRARG